MEYKSIAFDMNKPIVQQIKVPLNSAYGVAVKVYKDGQLVSADLSVDGIAASDGPNGMKLVELSSGDIQTMKKLNVVAEGDGVSRQFYLQVQEQDLGYFEK